MTTTPEVRELQQLRERVWVFRDRAHAGEVLAGLLGDHCGADALILAIPAGGLPVAAALADALRLELDVAPVSKITLPWNTESGYGAVAFDGTVRLNQPLLERLGLTEQQVQDGIAGTRDKVLRRVERFRGQRPFPELADCACVLVDDGLASGFTMLTAVEALRKAGAKKLLVAVPTGHSRSVDRLLALVDGLFCANVRSGLSFAVADAYERWYDVGEEEALQLLNARWQGK
jgi:predicted phosphoribosyltransferase